MEGRTVQASQSYLSELALPNDVNGLGTLLGGRIMHLVDIAGAVAAARHARQFVVTAAFDHMAFLEPVYEGELIVLRASVNRAFNTSMEVGVKVYAENMRAQEEQRHVASAYLTFVALDKDRQKQRVPPLIAETDEQRRRYEEAGQRREYRLAHR
jgi:acyl-CoA hydrolase